MKRLVRFVVLSLVLAPTPALSAETSPALAAPALAAPALAAPALSAQTSPALSGKTSGASSASSQQPPSEQPSSPHATSHSSPSIPPANQATQQNYLRKAAPSEVKPAASPAEHSDPSLLRVIIALALVGILGGFAVYTKRKKGGGSSLLRDRVRLHTIGAVQLGPKAQVALISVGREAILVGVSEQGITCLRSFREDELGSLTTRSTPAPSESENIEMEAEDAFNNLLLRAAQSGPVRGEPKTKVAATPMRRAASPAPIQGAASSAIASASSSAVKARDEFTPSNFRDDYDDEDELEQEIPPHLVDLLAQASLQTTRGQAAPSNVKPLRPHHQPQQQSHFAEPEGQAAELMRRFAELGK